VSLLDAIASGEHRPFAVLWYCVHTSDERGREIIFQHPQPFAIASRI
jgi:hypothetical protein